jgi:hypothetical protein
MTIACSAEIGTNPVATRPRCSGILDGLPAASCFDAISINASLGTAMKFERIDGAPQPPARAAVQRSTDQRHDVAWFLRYVAVQNTRLLIHSTVLLPHVSP